MASLVQLHRQRMAAQAAAQAERNPGPTGKVLGQMPTPRADTPVGRSQLAGLLSAALAEDLKALSGMASHERKAEYKREQLLPKYRDNVQRLMQAGTPHALLPWFLVWCFDAGAVGEGLAVAAWCREHDLALPEKFSSSLDFFVADHPLQWAESAQKAGQSFEPYLSNTLEEMEANAWDVPDALRAGYYRLKGLAAFDAGDWPAAVEHLQKADSLGAKVQTKLKEAQKKQEKAAPQAEAEE